MTHLASRLPCSCAFTQPADHPAGWRVSRCVSGALRARVGGGPAAVGEYGVEVGDHPAPVGGNWSAP
jgi:hypothetical protein